MTWRGVVFKQDDSDLYTLLTVRGHDAAYEWASRRTITVNAAADVIELRDVAALEELGGTTQRDRCCAVVIDGLLVPEDVGAAECSR